MTAISLTTVNDITVTRRNIVIGKVVSKLYTSHEAIIQHRRGLFSGRQKDNTSSALQVFIFEKKMRKREQLEEI